MFKGDYFTNNVNGNAFSSRYVTLPTSALAGFHEGPLSWSNVLEFGVLLLLFFFLGGVGRKEKRQPTTKSAHTWTRAGARSHHCTIPAP